MMFGTVKECILEILDERLCSFHTKMMALMGAHSLVGGSVCFKRGRTGNICRDLTVTTTTTPISDLICFHCNQRGHKKAHCPSLTAARPVSAPAPTTLRITEGLQG